MISGWQFKQKSHLYPGGRGRQRITMHSYSYIEMAIFLMKIMGFILKKNVVPQEDLEYLG